MPVRPRPRRRRSPDAGLASLAVDKRLVLGLTQQDLADLSGVSRRSIAALEAGKETLRLDVLLGALDALGLDLVVLPGGRGELVATTEGGAVVRRITAVDDLVGEDQ